MSNSDVIKLVLAALFGAAASFIATALKASRDEQRDLCNQFADALLKAADLGAEYWLLPQSDPKTALLQARIMGAQAYLSHYRVLATDWFNHYDREAVGELTASFFDALSGGNFRGTAREVEPNRAEQCQESAAQLAVQVRTSNKRSLTIGAMLRRVTRSGKWR